MSAVMTTRPERSRPARYAQIVKLSTKGEWQIDRASLAGTDAMTIPMWTLLGFAAWTLTLLIATVGVYRWFNILFSNARIASFKSDQSAASWP
jgi:hypothetical protein